MHRIVATLAVLGALALPAAAQTLSFGQPELPSSLDSADVTDVYSLAVAINVTEPLIGYGSDDGALQPRLATSWTPNDDATVWTLTLREGVVFHDGTPFDAEAVRFNLERWNDPDHPHGHRGDGKAYVPWRWVFGGFGEESLLEEVRVVDRYTVELVLRASIGFLPFLELGFRFNRQQDVERAALGDRLLLVRIQALRESDRRPAITVGAHDFLRSTGVETRKFNALYLVATKHFEPAWPKIGRASCRERV